MEIFRAYKTELDPNNVQRTALMKHAGAARFSWNWGLAKRKQEYEETGKSSNAIEQQRQLTALKKTDFSWLYEVSKAAPEGALRDLDKAYKNFFRHVKNGEKQPGFPKFKSCKKGIGSFRLTGAIHITETHIKLPRIGWLRLKEHGYIQTDGIHILSVTVSESAGRWFVSVQCKQEIETTQAIGEPVGVDLGIKDLAVTSEGAKFENPKPLKKAQAKLKRLQRELSRRKKGGKNREKTRGKVAKVHQRIANIRRDTLHKATSAIAAKNKPDDERPSVIVLEDLNVTGMMKNHCLAQAISDVGFAEFRRQLEYKAVWHGSELVVADRFFPSSRLCRHCGCINSGLKLSEREWICDCGAVLDRDLNAAINLKNLAVRRVTPEQACNEQANACGEVVRPTAVSLAVSLRQEPSTESRGRFW
jgi:putative transposase